MTDDRREAERVPSPGEYIRDELKARGWTQEYLALVLDRPLPTVNRILLGKHAILPEMAKALAVVFGTTPEVWAEREARYRLSLSEDIGDDIRKRSRLFELAPVKELQKRGWIREGKDIQQIEDDVLRLLEINSVDEEPRVSAAMRKTSPDLTLTPVQRAWCFRARQMARTLDVAPYDEGRLSELLKKLRRLAAYPVEANKVAEVLAAYGIRFVVIEPLSGCKIDGAALWLDDDSPVVAVSIRYDRLDAFWFTLFHELSHIKHRDESVDSDLSEAEGMHTEVKPAFERRADEEAAAALIPADEMTSFIRRVGPLYSKDRIIQFAHRVKMHPGVIVGQLQHRGEIGFRANREMLSKVRGHVISTALTDGWGHSIELG